MDSFIFKSTGPRRIEEIPGESQLGPDLVWGSDGASLEVMHVDPVIPGGTATDGLTMPRVLGSRDPMDGFEDPSFGFEDPSFGFEDPLFG